MGLYNNFINIISNIGTQFDFGIETMEQKMDL